MPDLLSYDSFIKETARHYARGSPDLEHQLAGLMQITLLEMRDGLGEVYYTRRLRDRVKNFLKRRRYTDYHFTSIEELCDAGYQFSSSGDVIPPGRFNNDE